MLLLAASWQPSCWAASPPRSVLILDQSGSGLPAYAEISLALRSALGGAPGPAISVYEEKLDLSVFESAAYEARLKDHLAAKYRDIPIGVMVAVGASALDLALNLRNSHWAALPIVFTAVAEGALTRLEIPPNVTGRTVQVSFANSMTAARAMVPGLQRVALVGDPLERQTFRRHFLKEPAFAAPSAQLIDLTGLAMSEITKRIAQLPDDSAIIYTTVNVDGDGTVYTPREALKRLAETARRPVVVDVETHIGHGGAGGFVVVPSRLGAEAAQLVNRILDGDDARQIPIATGDAMRPVFDWRELQRWNVDLARLPQGSDIRFREPGDWERYRWRILLFTAGLLLQSVLITWLLYAERRRRAAEANAAMLFTEVAHSNRVSTAGALTASIAHEIRQPLTAIVSGASAALNWLNRSTPDLGEARVALQNIINEGHRADDVISNIRAMFRKDVLPREPSDMNRLIRQVLAMTERRVAIADVAVRTSFSESLPPVLADPVQLQQVILNLVVNAVEAMSSRPPASRVLQVATALENGRLSVTFEDTGPGMSAETLEHVFDPFFTTKPGGMGMGLAICKSIIEAHGGQLTASSRPGEGATFRIVLPVQGASS
jgi:signal transduction histidine kinase